MRRIVIANQKGGVAKTTTAVNLATGLGMVGQQTLLIDMDPQANATFAVLGDEPETNSAYDLIIHSRALSEVIRRTNRPNLDIVPSNIDLAAAEVELISKVGGQTRLRSKLNEISQSMHYDFVIIDAPPSLGFLTINALAAADEVIIPVPASVFALKGIQRLEETISSVRTDLGCPALHISGVLLTVVDATNVSRDVRTEVEERFNSLVFRTSIPKTIKIEESHGRTQSIFEYAPNNSAATAYSALVQEVLHREHQ
jgi:chromosome partitioning protein